jgi:penicillin-binding protein 2
MEFHEPKPLPRWRVAFLGVLFAAGLSLLGCRLYRVQVARSEDYAQRQVRQSVRRVLLPAPRGRILDRQGRVLADNRPDYCIAVYVEELRQPGRWSNTVNAVDAELDRLAAVLRRPRTCTREDIANHVSRSLPLPLVAWEHADDATLARLAESREPFPGVDVFVRPERTYPQGRLAAHLLGFVGRGEPAGAGGADDFQYRLPGMRGRGGVEREYDDLLCGLPGGRLIRVDAAGYRHDEWVGRQPVPGRDLTLTLDARVQAEMEIALAGVRGAGVVLDPRNGDVLALASLPAFDPNALSPAPAPAAWRALLADPARPLFNRAIAGGYPPGSTFKPFVALAALAAGGVPPARAYDCRGAYQLGSLRIHCSHESGHGVCDLRRGLEVSCNVYFCSLGHDLGYDPIALIARQAGFGRRTGIDLPGEGGGLLPSPAWKRSHGGEGWSAGDTCNTAIGQGLLLVSPLQMAVAGAALANGGRVLRPRLVRGDRAEGDVVGRAEWPADALAVVRDGMLDVVSGEEGTGRRARVAGVAVAAKTGTAEHGPAGRRRKYGWMVAFAPVEAPRVTVAMVVEDAETGGATVGPRLQRVLLAVFADEIAAGLNAGGTP